MDVSLFPLVAESVNSHASMFFQDAVGSQEDWPTAIIASSAFIAGCALISVIIWQVFLTARRSMEVKATDEIRAELRSITQRAVASSEASATELARVSQSVTDLRVRMGDIEKILKEVE